MSEIAFHEPLQLISLLRLLYGLLCYNATIALSVKFGDSFSRQYALLNRGGAIKIWLVVVQSEHDSLKPLIVFQHGETDEAAISTTDLVYVTFPDMPVGVA